MVKQIEVDSFLKEMGQGMSRPILVMGNDFNSYILKNQKVDSGGNIVNFNCMFLNEILAYQLGIYLNIPMPEAAIAFVDDVFIDQDPTIRFAYRFEEGVYFACSEIKNIENNTLENFELLKDMNKKYISRPWNQFFSNVGNKDDISKILAFDILIGNFDRYTNEGNLLVSQTENGRKIYAIDHGHAFWGPIWEQNKIINLNAPCYDIKYIESYIRFIQFKVNNAKLNGLGGMFNALEGNIDLTSLDNHSFMDIVEKIESISEEFLDGCLNIIPNEWFINKDWQIACYKKFILEQKNLLRHFIQYLAEQQAFSNYTGGELEWKQKSQCGTA